VVVVTRKTKNLQSTSDILTIEKALTDLQWRRRKPTIVFSAGRTSSGGAICDYVSVKWKLLSKSDEERHIPSRSDALFYFKYNTKKWFGNNVPQSSSTTTVVMPCTVSFMGTNQTQLVVIFTNRFYIISLINIIHQSKKIICIQGGPLLLGAVLVWMLFPSLWWRLSCYGHRPFPRPRRRCRCLRSY